MVYTNNLKEAYKTYNPKKVSKGSPVRKATKKEIELIKKQLTK